MSQSSQLILIVDDSDEDFYSAVRALKKAGLANPIQRCIDGDDALDFLFHRGQYADAVRPQMPSMILLDLNLPGRNGVQVLQQIKGSDHLKAIPVIVLTTSADPRDIDTCYNQGANSYIQKPVDFPGFVAAIQRLRDYWFEVALLPKPPES